LNTNNKKTKKIDKIMVETKVSEVSEEIEETAETNDLSEEAVMVYRKKTVSISQETPRLLNDELNGKNSISELETFYKSKKERLKKKNNNKPLSYKQFKAFYEEYAESETITTKNEDLKEFFEDIFDVLEGSISKSETIANLTQESAVYLVEGSLLAIRNKLTNMKFDELVKDYDSKAISKDAFEKIKTVYNKIVNIIA
jgi:hypothetical protein